MKHLKITLQPGQQLPVALSGFDFVYCKRAAEEFELIVNGDTLTMGIGDKSRFERRLTQGDQAVLHNPNAFPLALVLIVGRGDYERQVIEGELNVVPSIIKADGTRLPDRRIWLDLEVNPDQLFTGLDVQALEVNGGSDTLRTEGAPKTLNCFDLIDGIVYFGFYGDDIGYTGRVRRYDMNTKTELSSFHMTADLSPGSEAMTYQHMVVFNGGEDVLIFASVQNGQPKLYHTKWGVQPSDNHIHEFSMLNGVNSSSLAAALDEENSQLHIINKSGVAQYEYSVYAFDLDQMTVGSHLGGRVITIEDHGSPGWAPSAAKPFYLPDYGYCAVHRYQNQSSNYDVWVYSLSDGVRRPELEQFFAVDSHGAPSDIGQVFGQYKSGAIHTLETFTAGSTVYFDLTERWPKTAYFGGRGSAWQVGQDAGTWRLRKPGESVYTDAVMSGVYVGGGKYQWDGEVIRAALDLFLRRNIGADYLDYLYGVKIWDTGEVQKFQEAYSGNYTFARLGYADDFKFIAPGRISLFVEPEILEL